METLSRGPRKWMWWDNEVASRGALAARGAICSLERWAQQLAWGHGIGSGDDVTVAVHVCPHLVLSRDGGCGVVMRPGGSHTRHLRNPDTAALCSSQSLKVRPFLAAALTAHPRIYAEACITEPHPFGLSR